MNWLDSSHVAARRKFPFGFWAADRMCLFATRVLKAL